MRIYGVCFEPSKDVHSCPNPPLPQETRYLNSVAADSKNGTPAYTKRTVPYEEKGEFANLLRLLTVDLQALTSPDCLSRPKTAQDAGDKVASHPKVK